MYLWIIVITVGSLLLIMITSTVMLIIGIAIGCQRKNESSSHNVHNTLTPTQTATPIYEDVAEVLDNSVVQLNNNVAYGHISEV